MTEAVKERKVEEIKADADAGLKCPVNRALVYVTEFLAGPMCGRCFPCAMGSYEARIRLQNLTEGRGTDADLAALRRIAAEMTEGSMCKKGKDTARFILEWMETDAYAAHLVGRCPEQECKAFIEYRIVPQNCIICGLCKDACKHNAIIGEKKTTYQSGFLPFEIRQKRCVKCGDCLPVCPTGAVIIQDIKAKEPAAV
ncbi:MAG: NADH-ubiquinone oxidoreductase-F iron-sulfur binding region domain-containing protein [Thermodesulfovibrionales bacterium]